MLGLVLLGSCGLQLTSLSSIIVLQPPLLCEGSGGTPLYMPGDSSVMMDHRLPCDSTAQSSILSIGSVSLVLLLRFPVQSWTVAAFPCFTEEEVGRQHQRMDRPGICQVQEGSGEQEKLEETGCEIVCGAPATLAVS